MTIRQAYDGLTRGTLSLCKVYRDAGRRFIAVLRNGKGQKIRIVMESRTDLDILLTV